MTYSSRSRIETFQECNRRGYINYLWDGRGLQKRAVSIYLSTGTYTHIGLERLLQNFYLATTSNPTEIKEEWIDEAVLLARESYWKEVTERGFDLEEGESKENEKFVLFEQIALVEAFIRSFAIRVLPDLLARFCIIAIEREESIQNGELIIEGKLDVILEEITTSDIYIISFKTAANWDRRQEKANEHDNQGLSETYLLESRLRQENANIVALIHDATINSPDYDEKIKIASKKYTEYLSKFLKKDQVMGVLMIYMLKGKRYESYSRPGLWEQHSPLIRGYRKLVGTEYEYAGSLYYDNPSNKSGKGKLGKGWEPFNVWESEEVGFIKGWIHKAANNELGQDIIGQSFKIPAPYFRRQEHLDSWYRQTLAIEQEIQEKLKLLEEVINHPANSQLSKKLDYFFPQSRKHCHYPTDCFYLDICYNNEIFNDPIGSGKFIYRKPHHVREVIEHDRLYQISKASKESTAENKEGKGVSREDIKSKTGTTIFSEAIGEIEEVVIDG